MKAGLRHQDVLRLKWRGSVLDCWKLAVIVREIVSSTLFFVVVFRAPMDPFLALSMSQVRE